MNLRDLRYLVALADERHFGRAAERCHVSQPTLSAQIRKLELYLGVPLVERQPKGAALTPIGRQVVERARRLLQESDAILELAEASRDPLAGQLRIALIPTVGPYLLPRVAPLGPAMILAAVRAGCPVITSDPEVPDDPPGVRTFSRRDWQALGRLLAESFP